MHSYSFNNVFIYTYKIYVLQVKASLLSFSTLKIQFQNHYYISLTCKRENGAPSIDTACPAGLVLDYITLVACPAPSHNSIPVRQHVKHQHQYLQLSCKKLSSLLVLIWQRGKRNQRRCCQRKQGKEEQRVTKGQGLIWDRILQVGESFILLD